MGSWIASSPAEEARMLDACGVSSIQELFSAIPRGVALDRPLDLPSGMSEIEVSRAIRELADSNTVYRTALRGAGSYRRYIPAAVKRIAAKETFVTAYTPYQAEISQGILQSIFEYQTMVCELTGMDASNASVYDGATAAAEAVAMCRDGKRTVAYVSGAAHPHAIETIKTYCFGADAEVRIIPAKDGATDLEAFARMIDSDGEACCAYIAQPNFFGLIEDAAAFAEIAHAAGAKFVMGCDPVSLAVLKTPAECGADIAVGEGQSLGMPMSWGGPSLGFMACRADMIRRLPGRIVGETVDSRGERAFVLTLQAREQHIRRERASSNICSNEALCALTAACYLSVMGDRGLRSVATQSASKAHYAAACFSSIPGFARLHGGEFFCEFATACPDVRLTLERLAARGILGGLPIEGGILWCVTEVVTKAEIDLAVAVCADIARETGGAACA